MRMRKRSNAITAQRRATAWMNHPLVLAFLLVETWNLGAIHGWIGSNNVPTRTTRTAKIVRDAVGSSHQDIRSSIPVIPNAQSSFAEEKFVEETNTRLYKLKGKLLKQIRQTCLQYNMLEEGDHIMICVSGGKDSATLLSLVKQLQRQLPIQFNVTAVHVDQKQPGYNGASLIAWLEEMMIPYLVVTEDTYSVVVDKTEPGKSFCTVCSRLRRGILYSTALTLGCNKIMLGHHADDCLETLLLNMIHTGQTKAMPARYTSQRGSLAVMRPLIQSMETDIAEYAHLSNFPILPCNLCSNQANLQRPQVKLLLETIQASLNPNAKRNMLNAVGDVRPSHLLDQSLREMCGMDPITGQVEASDEDEAI